MSDYDRYRDQGDQGRRRDFEDYRQETSGRSNEGRSWRGGTDRDFEPQQVGARGYGYGQQNQSRYGEGMSTGYTGDRSYGPQDYGRDDSRGGYDRGQDYGRDQGQGGYRSQGRPNYGRGGYGSGQGGSGQGGWDYETHGYAPGAQIWGQRDRGSSRGYSQNRSSDHDFEPDYLHWREQQLNNFDNDYRSWRDERRTKFTSDFDTWRQSRSDNVKAEAANPYVGDVSEGGVGRTTTKSEDRNKQ
jgi:hypothetical protein